MLTHRLGRAALGRAPRAALGLALGLALGCGAARGPAPSQPATPASPAAAAPAIGEAELAELRRWLDRSTTPAAPSAAAIDAALRCLQSPDGELRDGVGFEVFARWLGKERVLGDAAVDAVRTRLVAQLAVPGPGEGDAVFGRSFAALVLSAVAAHELGQPRWTSAELAAQVDAARAYAAAEVDLRGYVPGKGWAHAAAHVADWMKMLGRHPKLTAVQADELAGSLVALAARRHGYRLAHGEEDRLAAALRSLVDRGALPDATFDRHLAALTEPLRAGWPQPFDYALYAAQRNARALIYALFTSLSLSEEPAAKAAAARVRAELLR